MEKIKSKLKDTHAFVLDKTKKRPLLTMILKNVGWLSFDRLFQLFVSFLVIVWVIRYLGPEEFGLLSYAWAYVGLFATFMTLGVEQIITRELVEHKNKTNVILGTGIILQLFASFIISLICIITAFVFFSTNWLIFVLIVLSTIPNIIASFYLFNNWFDSNINSKYTVIARNVTMVITALLKIFFILTGQGVIYFALVGLIEVIIMVLFLTYFYKKLGQHISLFKFDYSYAKKLVSESWLLMLTTFFLSLSLRGDQLLIGNILSISDVGLYSVAVKISEFANFIPVIIISSLFPVLVASKSNKVIKQLRIDTLFGVLFLIGLIFAIIVSIGAPILVYFLYGSSYSAASNVLSIYAWSMIPMFIFMGVQKYLILEKLPFQFFVITLFGAIINILLNIILLPIIGIQGAAIATLLSYTITFVPLYFFKETRIYWHSVLKSINLFATIKSVRKIILKRA